MNSNYSQNRLEYLDFICTLFRQKIITFFSHVYLKINLQAAGNGQKEAVAPLVHTRMLNVKINDYGSYDPSPSMDKPHFKLIPNWWIMYPCMLQHLSVADEEFGSLLHVY